jgi:hypothetical protein
MTIRTWYALYSDQTRGYWCAEAEFDGRKVTSTPGWRETEQAAIDDVYTQLVHLDWARRGVTEVTVVLP